MIAFTFSGANLVLLSVTRFLLALNILSEGALVGGALKYFLANFPIFKYFVANGIHAYKLV